MPRVQARLVVRLGVNVSGSDSSLEREAEGVQRFTFSLSRFSVRAAAREAKAAGGRLNGGGGAIPKTAVSLSISSLRCRELSRGHEMRVREKESGQEARRAEPLRPHSGSPASGEGSLRFLGRRPGSHSLALPFSRLLLSRGARCRTGLAERWSSRRPWFTRL